MPHSLPKPCAHRGCPALTHSRFCPEHQKQYQRDQDAGRPTSSQRGYDSKWQAYTKAYLAKHPYCADPYNKHAVLVPSQVVDHKTPHKGDMKLFWDKTNHRALCVQCHNFKTAKFDGGFGRR